MIVLDEHSFHFLLEIFLLVSSVVSGEVDLAKHYHSDNIFGGFLFHFI